MRRLLYFMVTWSWIKQRPHFLAEQLNEHYDVTLFCHRVYRRSLQDLNSPPRVSRTIDLWRLPFDAKLPFLAGLTDVLFRAQVSRYIHPADIVWTTHPSAYAFLRSHLTDGNLVVYDCMDDCIEFPYIKRNPSRRQALTLREHALCERANLILASAEHLRDTLVSRHNLSPTSVTVVNNGVARAHPATAVMPEDLALAFRSSTMKIVYVGTISEWFDFDLVLTSLRENPTIEYMLFGPAATSLPQHERLRHFGPVPHELVPTIMAAADVLVMPFQLTELVRGVDPVKAYEYVCANKPAILVRYPETEKFARYAYLYSSHHEYHALVSALQSGRLSHPRASRTEIDDFSNRNTWQARVADIVRLLDRAQLTMRG